MTPDPPDGSQRPTLGDGRYELVALLGRGGMAEVYQATDLRLGRTVAVKRLRSNLAGDQTFQTRFRREAQSAASLNHPAIVAVYDTGEEPDPHGSGLMLPYIVMEMVRGRTLRDILREGRKILPERALEIVGTTLSALDYSHRAGIIHRDIKPANVMLTPAGDVKVMDFGIARAIADSSATMTQTAAVVGTAHYLSPEQARGEQVDARSDLYSTGCLLYELLCGRPPFVGESPVSVAYQHVREQPDPPSTYDSQIPPEIDAIAMKSLAKNTEDRYQSASQMRADLTRALEGEPVQAPAVASSQTEVTEQLLPTPPAEPPPGDTTEIPRATGDSEPPNRRTALWVALVALVVAIIVAALVVVPRLLASDSQTAQVKVPDVVGSALDQAKSTLQENDLNVGDVQRVNDSSVKADHVVSQSVDKGTMVDEGTEVDLTVSKGVKTVVVPDVTDDTLESATSTLEDLGLDVQTHKDEQSTERENEVTSTDPKAGVTVPVGSEITVSYSTGYVSVPSVVGEKQAAAANTLRDAGFQVLASMQPNEAPAGTVVRQNPTAGSMQPYGSYITIFVSLGPTQSPTPTTPTEPTPTTPTPPTTTAPSTPPESTSPTESPTPTTPTSPTTTDTSPTHTATSPTSPPKKTFTGPTKQNPG